jgi:hypothetical protein
LKEELLSLIIYLLSDIDEIWLLKYENR